MSVEILQEVKDFVSSIEGIKEVTFTAGKRYKKNPIVHTLYVKHKDLIDPLVDQIASKWELIAADAHKDPTDRFRILKSKDQNLVLIRFSGGHTFELSFYA